MKKKLDSLELLDALSKMGSNGRAEEEDPQRLPLTYYPVPTHLRAFDPSVKIIVGPRGSGKTELFRAIIEQGLLKAASRIEGVRGIDLAGLDDSEWVIGYPIGSEFPDGRGLRSFISKNEGNDDTVLELWFAYIIRLVFSKLDPSHQKSLKGIVEAVGGDPFQVHKEFAAVPEQIPVLALDQLDRSLDKNNKYIFIGFDELDTLGGTDWETMASAINGLVAFWANYSRRWKKLRGKLFLRTDLFDKYAVHGGADLAKLAANRVDLYWNDKNLYLMLLKRMANSSPELLQYFRQLKGKVKFKKDPQLGFIPIAEFEKDVRPYIEKLIGKYMGVGVKKGLTYRWLINHIKDGNGQAIPRPLVRLIELGALYQIGTSNPVTRSKLIEPTYIRRALDQVSREHVDHSLHEWPWLTGVAIRLKGEQVPI